MLSFPVAVDAFVWTRLWICQEFGLDIDAEASFSILRVNSANCRKCDSEDFSVFEATASAPFDWFEIEVARGFLELGLSAAFDVDFIMVCEYVRDDSGNISKLVCCCLEVSVVENVDAVFGKAFAYMRIVVKHGYANPCDVHIPIEELFEHIFHVCESVAVRNDRIASEYNMAGRKAFVDEVLKCIERFSVGEHVRFVDCSTVA